MGKYTVYHGEFPCHTCKEVVVSLRCYSDTKELTWMCKSKHISTVQLIKKKRDYEREERE